MPYVFIHPSSKGWMASPAQGPGSRFDSLADLAGSLRPGSEVSIALPASQVVVEKMSMPALDRNELRGMVYLQLEKSLPFPVEDVTCNFQIIKQREADSELLAAAVNNSQFEALCKPLGDRGFLPRKVTFFAMHLAQLCPKEQVGLVIYREQERLVLAIFENRKLAYVQTLPDLPVTGVMEEIPAILFGAELDGVSTDFQSIYLDRGLAEMSPLLVELLALPVELVDIDQPLEQVDCDLLPESFQRDRKHREQVARIKSNLFTAAIVYLVLLAAGFACLIWLQSRVNRVEARIARIQPDLNFVNSRVARWNALAPAIDRERFVVELLNQVCASLPSDGIRITSFEVSKDQLMVEGEAPSAALAIEFGDQIKANPALQNFHFEMGPPALLPNEHAQLRIIGKL